jgi:hypothetical protein
VGMRKVLPVLYVLAGAALLLIPAVAYAQGLVPCTGIECNLCNVGELMQNVIDYTIVGLAIPLAAAMFAYAGVLYVTAGANLHRIAKAHKIFKNVLIGFLIAISGWLVINTIMTVMFNKSFFNGGEWFQIQCVERITNNPEGGGRLIGTSFLDLLNVIIPQAKAPKYTAYTTTPDGGGYTACPEGSIYNPERSSCVTIEGNIPVPPVTPSGDFPLCTNSYCSVSVLQAEGLTATQATVMSCIAMTESSGRPDIGCSASATPCGLYQINNGNWDRYAPAGCEARSQKHNGTCNRKTAVRMLQSGLGYQPWSGRDERGVHWNPRALGCVQKYDPNTSLKVI